MPRFPKHVLEALLIKSRPDLVKFVKRVAQKPHHYDIPRGYIEALNETCRQIVDFDNSLSHDRGGLRFFIDDGHNGSQKKYQLKPRKGNWNREPSFFHTIDDELGCYFSLLSQPAAGVRSKTDVFPSSVALTLAMKAWGRKNAPLACEVAYLQRNSRFAPQQKLPRICKKGLEPFNEIILGTSLPDNPTGLGRQDLKASTQLARHALLQELTKRPIFDHEHDAMGKEVRCRNPKVVKFQESMDTGAADKEPEDGERNKSVDPKMAIKYGHCGTFAGFTQLVCIKKSFESIYRDLPEGLEFKGFSLAVRNFKHAEHRLDKLFEDSFAKMESLDVNSILFSINGKRMGEQSKGKKLRALRQAIESGFGENWKSVLQPSCDLCLKTLPDLGMDESYHTYLPDNKVQAKQCDRDVMGVLAYARALRAGGGAPSPPGPDPQTPGQAQDSIGAAESGKEKLETIPGKINYYVRQGRGRANNGATKMYDEDGEKEEGKRNRQIEQFWTIIADAFLADGED